MSLDTNTFNKTYLETLKKSFAKKFCELNIELDEEAYSSYYNMMVRRYGTDFTNCCEDMGLAMFDEWKKNRLF